MYIVIGGAKSRLLILHKKCSTSINLPIKQGKSSQGAFSLTIHRGKYVIVGGDYYNDRNADSIACIITLSDSQSLIKNPTGYQSCIEYLCDSTYISTGTSGTHLSADNGRRWHQIDTISFNVCQKAKNGKLILLAGNDGENWHF